MCSPVRTACLFCTCQLSFKLTSYLYETQPTTAVLLIIVMGCCWRVRVRHGMFPLTMSWIKGSSNVVVLFIRLRAFLTSAAWCAVAYSSIRNAHYRRRYRCRFQILLGLIAARLFGGSCLLRFRKVVGALSMAFSHVCHEAPFALPF